MTDADRRRILIAAVVTAFLLGAFFPWEVMPWHP